MPELPEVETVCTALRAALTDRRIVGVATSGLALREPVDVPLLRKTCLGREVVSVRRRGKFIVVELAARHALVLHLGMSGSCRIDTADRPVERHDHVRFDLDDGRRWVFNDPRRFGLAKPIRLAEPGADPDCLADLGPEPLGPSFDGAHLYRRTRGLVTPVKSLLLDQRVVAGVGNIYASEALFLAGISPRRRAGRLLKRECAALVEGIRRVLQDAIACGGTTLRDFRALDGREGEFAICLRVYGKAGEPCSRCDTPAARIRRLVQSGRSTYYCPSCQC